jgi:hypothetical protein
MANLTVKGNVSGTGTVTLEPPNTNSTYTVTLPSGAATLVTTSDTQTLTNKTIQGGAITRGTAQASTSGTIIDFEGIPSWVKRVTILFDGLSLSGTANPLIQIGDSGGVEITGYVGAGSNFSTGGQAVTSYTAGFGINAGVAASSRSGAVRLSNLSGNMWVADGVVSGTDAVFFVGGVKTLSDTLDRVRITTTNGTDTFDNGSINIMLEG